MKLNSIAFLTIVSCALIAGSQAAPNNSLLEKRTVYAGKWAQNLDYHGSTPVAPFWSGTHVDQEGLARFKVRLYESEARRNEMLRSAGHLLTPGEKQMLVHHGDYNTWTHIGPFDHPNKLTAISTNFFQDKQKIEQTESILKNVLGRIP